jgi:hypothetical protein
LRWISLVVLGLQADGVDRAALDRGPDVGPCTKAATNRPLLASGGDQAGPGGACVVTGSAGDQWLAYHAWTPSAIGYDNDGSRSLRFASLALPMISQPSDADRPTVAQDAAHRSKGVTHGPPRDERLWLEPRDRFRRSNRRFCWLNDQFADELIEEFLAYNQNVKVMKLSMLEDQVTPAKSCASDTAISCGVAAGPTCRL